MSQTDYWEGAVHTVRVNAYERSAAARAKCIADHGARCVACGIDFGVQYGDAAKGLIHVHHLVPVAKVKKEYRIDPIADLLPVCPNCHAVIHRREPPYEIEEIRAMLGNSRSAVT